MDKHTLLTVRTAVEKEPGLIRYDYYDNHSKMACALGSVIPPRMRSKESINAWLYLIGQGLNEDTMTSIYEANDYVDFLTPVERRDHMLKWLDDQLAIIAEHETITSEAPHELVLV